MISKKLTGKDLIGKRVRVDTDLVNNGGEGVGIGAIATITDLYAGVAIKTDKCPHCQQYARISRVSRYDLTLIDETKEQHNGNQ